MPPEERSKKLKLQKEKSNMNATLQKENQTTTENRPQEFVAPEVNILETKDGYVLEAEMPGVAKDGLEITLEDNELTIVGHRKAEGASGEALFQECRRADYRRVFELDPAIDSGKISAKIEQGVLTLTLPKSERVKPRKIAVD
jgi:HSP20 family protein